MPVTQRKRRCPKGMHGVGRQSPAFTLMELVVVAGIIAVLASLVLPVLAGAMARAKSVACLAQLRKLQQVLPGEGTSKLFLCPTDHERRAWGDLTRTNASYFWRIGPGQPQSIFAGDRNIRLLEPGGISFGLTGAVRLLRTNSFGWGPEMHRPKGNLLLGDGSAHMTDSRKLNLQVSVQAEPMFEWYFPNGS